MTPDGKREGKGSAVGRSRFPFWVLGSNEIDRGYSFGHDGRLCFFNRFGLSFTTSVERIFILA